MVARIAAALACLLAALVSTPAGAAASAQPLTPLNESVAGNESQDFSVRFYDALGKPSVGEAVTFENDACGRFQNGAFQVTVPTDASGVATARFTAFAQGIACRLVASAGAQVQFNVLTYLPANAYLAATLPPRIVPGQGFRVTAAAMYGSYRLYNVDIAARIVAGTGSAGIAPAVANSGQAGTVSFDVAPDARLGAYEIELQFRDRVQRFSVKLSPAPWQDLWWAGWNEDGWGLSVVQHGDVLFSVIYAYDAAGRPIWYAMPGGSWNAAHTVFSGPLFLPHGSPFTAYDVSRFVPGAPVGEASLDFTDPVNAVLSYTIDGVAGRKAIRREPFGPVDASAGITVGDMWWGGPGQDGWGLAVLQQYRTIFAVWFTYDASGDPTWLVMPSGYWSDPQTWQGRAYRTTSSPWLGQPYDKSLFKDTDVGTFRLRFSGDTATLDYVIDGRSGSIALQRQPF